LSKFDTLKIDQTFHNDQNVKLLSKPFDKRFERNFILSRENFKKNR